MDIAVLLDSYLTIDNIIKYTQAILLFLVMWNLWGNSYIRKKLSMSPEKYNKIVKNLSWPK
jgi:hypothetical protein